MEKHYFQKEIETMPVEELKKLQSEKLVKQVKQKLYSRTLARYNIACVEPEEQYWEEIRYFIECVKQNKYDNELKDRFLRFLDGYDVDNIILGCTEFPLLLRHIDMGEGTSNFYDPLTYGIQEIHRIIS